MFYHTSGLSVLLSQETKIKLLLMLWHILTLREVHLFDCVSKYVRMTSVVKSV